MTIKKAVLEQVRQRAKGACEYCGITENDAGGLLTIDHYHPQSKGGSDHIDNLIYCCNRCNTYKFNYFPKNKGDEGIWNPRKEPYSRHFFELDNGELKALSTIGEKTIRLLRLNRSPLISYRFQRKTRQEERELLERYQNLVELFRQANQELRHIAKNQQELLEQQQQLLKFLLEENKG